MHGVYTTEKGIWERESAKEMGGTCRSPGGTYRPIYPFHGGRVGTMFYYIVNSLCDASCEGNAGMVVEIDAG